MRKFRLSEQMFVRLSRGTRVPGQKFGNIPGPCPFLPVGPCRLMDYLALVGMRLTYNNLFNKIYFLYAYISSSPSSQSPSGSLYHVLTIFGMIQKYFCKQLLNCIKMDIRYRLLKPQIT